MYLENRSKRLKDYSIKSITKGPRLSNFELLRILSMFLVLVVHADFFSIGVPSYEELRINPINVLFRTLFEALSIICVNVFILISGWFRIKSSIKGFSNFIFQCIFFYFSIYVLFCCFNLDKFSLKTLITIGISLCSNWFINSYIALYLLAPILNSFIENTIKKKFRILIIYFFIFQTFFGILKTTNYIAGGFSVFSFIGLYLLAAYVQKYVRLKSQLCYLVLFFSSTFLISSIYLLGLYLEFNVGNVFAYINPLVILSSLSILIFFSKIKIKNNRFVNWLSASTFAVFLFHCHPNISKPYFKKIINFIYEDYSGVECIMLIFLILIIFYVIAIILDQPRKICWRKFILPHINKIFYKCPNTN